MHANPSKRTPIANQLRIALILVFCTAIATPAFAQMGSGGVGGGGGGGGSAGRGGGSRGQQQRPKNKRNQQPPVDPVQSREKLQKMLEVALTRGTGSPVFLANLFDQASTQPLPASAQSRKALAEALGTLKGKKLEAETATAIAGPITSAVNSEGLPAEDITAKKDSLKEALGTAGMDEQQQTTALAAWDEVCDEQNDESIKKLTEQIEEIQAEGDAGDDKKTRLAEGLTSLVSGEKKPEEAGVTKLATDMTKALDSAQLTHKEKAQLIYDVQAILNGADLAPAQLQPLLNSVRSTLKAGLAKQADSQAVVTDLQTIHKSLTASAAPSGN
jgi:hypothetical protein